MYEFGLETFLSLQKWTIKIKNLRTFEIESTGTA